MEQRNSLTHHIDWRIVEILPQPKLIIVIQEVWLRLVYFSDKIFNLKKPFQNIWKGFFVE